VHKLRKSLFDCIDQKITEGASWSVANSLPKSGK
jgi:hypothetical protein